MPTTSAPASDLATPAAPAARTALDDAQRAAWARDGYLVLPGFVAPAQVQAACAQARALVHTLASEAPRAVFSTRDRSRVADERLIASATEVHAFFEEDAIDTTGRLAVPPEQAINKIGHALHDRDAFFTAFSRGPALAALARALGLTQPQVWQSQLIFKQPRIGGEVGWHQDASFFVTTPHSVTTFWFALEDATRDNGCLWVQPGGHRGPLREQYLCLERAVAADGTPGPGGRLVMQPLDATPWPALDDAVALEVPAGTLVCFHGLLPHCSGPNRSARSRLAYTLHVTDGRCAYAPQNWLQRGAAHPVPGLD